MNNVIKVIMILVVCAILSGIGLLVYNEHNRINNLPAIEYTGTVVKESSLIDELLGKPVKYTFTSNAGIVLELTFETATLNTSNTYKLKYVSVPLVKKAFTATKQHNWMKINNDTYSLESIIIVQVQ